MKNQQLGHWSRKLLNSKGTLILLIVLAFCAFTKEADASHIIGGQISYTATTTPNVYTVRLSLYRDCDGINLPSGAPIRWRVSGTNNQVGQATIPRIAVNDISILCVGQVSPCASPSSTLAGVEEHVYEGNITFGVNSNFDVYYTQCCRPAGITTLVNSSTQGITLSTQLNTGIVNSSPTFLNPPTGQYCVGQASTLSLNAFDPDGDVVRYKLIDALGNNFSPINYATGVSGTSPMGAAVTVTVDSITGLITFTPNGVGRAIFSVEATEFRNGSPIGSVTRDIEVLSVNCGTNSNPVITPIANSIVHVGDSICVPVVVTDADGDSITVTATGAIIPPATFVVDSMVAGATYGTFCFTPVITDTGNTFTISINAVDNVCPVPATAVSSFNVTVPRPCAVTITSSATPTVCGLMNGTATSTLNNGVAPYSYSWTGPGSYSAGTQSISNLAAGTYYISIIDGNNCVGEDTVDVLTSSPLSLSASIIDISCLNNTGTITVNVMGGNMPYSYSLNGGTAQASNVFSGLTAGIYSIEVTDANGCTASNSFTVSTILDTTPPTASCANFTLVLTGATGTVTPMDVDNGSSDNCGIDSMYVYPNTFTCADVGMQTVTLVVKDAAGLMDSCTSTVTVDPNSVISIANCPMNITKPCIGGPGKKAFWSAPTAALTGPCVTPCIGGNAIPGFTFKGTHNGHSYYVSNSSNYKWTQAKAAAANAGGYVVSINDAAENAFVKSIIPNSCPGGEVWIGYNDAMTEGTFIWDNGDNSTYTNWKSGEPNNTGPYCSYYCHTGGADYALMKRYNGKWYDRRNCERNNFVLEIPCENPVTVVQVAGPPSGSIFTGGTTTQISYAAYTAGGDTAYCNFTVTIDSCTPAYCSPPNYNSHYEHIKRVELNTLDNLSGDDNGYGNYIGMSTSLSKGMTYPITLTPGFSGNKYREYWKVWIDWNYDGDFSDPGEMVAFGKSKYAITRNITVPNSATMGKMLRMRIIMKWGGYPTSPCAANCYGWGTRWGEVEEYSVMVNSNKTVHIISKTETIDENEPMTQSAVEFSRLYPNPISGNQGQITIDYRVLRDTDVEIAVQSIDGKMIHRQTVFAQEGINRNMVNLPALSSGIYTIILTTKDGRDMQKLSVE